MLSLTINRVLCFQRKQPLSMGFPSKKAFDEELYKLSKLLELVRSPFWLRQKLRIAFLKICVQYI